MYQWPPGMAWEGGGTRLGVDDAIFVKFKFVACSIALLAFRLLCLKWDFARHIGSK